MELSEPERERIERFLGERLVAQIDAVADERDQAELDLMRAKAETAQWVNAYNRELVARKAAEVRLAKVEVLADAIRGLPSYRDISRDLDAALSEPSPTNPEESVHG